LTLQGVPIWGPTSGDASCTRDFDVRGPRQLREGRADSHVPAHTSVLALHWRPGFGELTSITGYNHYAFNAYQPLNASSLSLVESREESQKNAFSTELRYQTQLLHPVNFMLGGYYQSSRYQHSFAAGVFPPSFQGAGSTFEQRSSTDGDTHSYFVELLWNIAAAWELDIGYRYTRERKRSTFNTLSVAPNVAAYFGAMHFTTDQQFTHSAPQASLTWRPARDFMAYAAYKTGFLSGGFAHAQVPTPFAQVQDFLFGDETARGGEVGTKLAVANGRLHFDLVSYHYDYDGLQVSTFQPASLSFAVQNAGKSRSKGVELRSLWQVTNAWSVDTAMTHGSTRYTRYIGACLPTATFATGCSVPLPGGGLAQDFKGFRTSFAPDWTARFGLEYRTTLTPALSLSFRAGVSHSDSYTVGDVLYQPAWTKYDGRIALSSSAWQAALIGNNLSNEAICSQAASRPLGGSGETVCWLDRAREVRFELTVQL
jgi:iron complex outermembrane receptor protein